MWYTDRHHCPKPSNHIDKKELKTFMLMLEMNEIDQFPRATVCICMAMCVEADGQRKKEKLKKP